MSLLQLGSYLDHVKAEIDPDHEEATIAKEQLAKRKRKSQPLSFNKENEEQPRENAERVIKKAPRKRQTKEVAVFEVTQEDPSASNGGNKKGKRASPQKNTEGDIPKKAPRKKTTQTDQPTAAKPSAPKKAKSEAPGLGSMMMAYCPPCNTWKKILVETLQVVANGNHKISGKCTACNTRVRTTLSVSK